MAFLPGGEAQMEPEALQVVMDLMLLVIVAAPVMVEQVRSLVDEFIGRVAEHRFDRMIAHDDAAVGGDHHEDIGIDLGY